jgi:hypothetical protein
LGIFLVLVLVLVVVLGLVLRETEVRLREQAPTLCEASLVRVRDYLPLPAMTVSPGMPSYP